MKMDGANRKRRIIIFAALYLSYCAYYLCRKNYGFWLDALTSDANDSAGIPSAGVRIGKASAGSIGSAFELCSGVSKIALAVFVDTHSPSRILAGALAISGFINLAIFRYLSFTEHGSQSVFVLAILWGSNGIVQSLGWPALARIFMSWFPEPEERGRWYSLLSTNQNLGAALAPILLTGPMSYWNWHASLYLPGFIGVTVAAFLYLTLSDSPHGASKNEKVHHTAARASSSRSARIDNSKVAEVIRKDVFRNSGIWLLAISYFCVSVARSGLGDWALKILGESWGLEREHAASCLFLLEVGGFLGSLGAGMVSDLLFAGKRAPVIGLLSFLTVLPILALVRTGPIARFLALSDTSLVPFASFFALGIFSFAPHMLIGLAAREWTRPQAASTAGGLVKFIAQVGGASAGAPLGALVTLYSWDFGLMVVAMLMVTSGLAMIPVWGVQAKKTE